MKLGEGHTSSPRRNFAVTAVGRSGTKFLATILNRSPTWTVRHEPGPRGKAKHTMAHLQRLNKRFDRDSYGEVNSFLRWVFADLSVGKKAVIVRDPFDVVLSTYNRRHRDLRSCADELAEGFRLLDGYIESGNKVFYFEHMTTEVDYLRSIATYLGVAPLELHSSYVKEESEQEPKVLLRGLGFAADGDQRLGHRERRVAL